MHPALPGDLARSGGVFGPSAAGNFTTASSTEPRDHLTDHVGPADVKRPTADDGAAHPPALAGLEVARATRELDELLALAFGASGHRARLLTALRRQDEALRLVLAAHQTGQVTLPRALLDRVANAVRSTPDLMDG